MSGLRRRLQGGLLCLAMLLLAGSGVAVAAPASSVLVLGRISDDPRSHHAQLQPLLDYVVARMGDVGIREGRILMARDAQQMGRTFAGGVSTGSRKPPALP